MNEQDPQKLEIKIEITITQQAGSGIHVDYQGVGNGTPDMKLMAEHIYEYYELGMSELAKKHGGTVTSMKRDG